MLDNGGAAMALHARSRRAHGAFDPEHPMDRNGLRQATSMHVGEAGLPFSAWGEVLFAYYLDLNGDKS